MIEIGKFDKSGEVFVRELGKPGVQFLPAGNDWTLTFSDDPKETVEPWFDNGNGDTIKITEVCKIDWAAVLYPPKLKKPSQHVWVCF